MLIDDIRKGESAELEFKSVPNEASERWLKTVVAFANCKGGRIVFGVADDRSVPGLPRDSIHGLRDSIADRIAGACSPMPEISVDVVNVEGRQVLELSVAQGRNCPYFLKCQGDTDGVYVRYDATTRAADGATLQELRLSGARKGYDAVPCRGLKVAEQELHTLCARLRAEAVENIPAGADERLLKPVTLAQLVKWGVLAEDGRTYLPNNAYALLTGNDILPVTVKCALFKGTDRSIFLDRHPISGSIIDHVNEAYKWVLSKLNLSATIKGLKRVDTYEIPPEAVRELIVNAVVHRTYVDGSSSPVSVALYDDRFEITSPGGLPRGMTLAKMLQGHSECRNQVLANVFAYMFFVENWGSGLIRVQQALSEAGLNPLEVQDFGNSMRFTVWRRRVSASKENREDNQDNREDNQDDREDNQDNREDNANAWRTIALTACQMRVCGILRDKPGISIRSLSEVLGIRKSVVEKHLKALKLKGVVERVGGTRGYWRILARFAFP